MDFASDFNIYSISFYRANAWNIKRKKNIINEKDIVVMNKDLACHEVILHGYLEESDLACQYFSFFSMTLFLGGRFARKPICGVFDRVC